jgi:ABC-2 type transport system permease protein
MFSKIFLFEIKYRLRKPDTYLFFLFFFIVNIIGAIDTSPLHAFANSPSIITYTFAGQSIFLMIISGGVMSDSLYRDIEFNVYESYLTLPISEQGYFWGRFLGSFLFVALIGSSLIWGSLMGTFIGGKTGLIPPDQVGPYELINYLQPFFGYALPNLFLTSALFFGLVAYTRDPKVIYFTSVILFFGYELALFTLTSLPNKIWVYILDPFAFAGVRLDVGLFSPEQRRVSLVPIEGWIMFNRILWAAIGLLILFATWWRFSFVSFFGGDGKKRIKQPLADHEVISTKTPSAISVDFTSRYSFTAFLSLARIELANIFRDNYFRLILLACVGSLSYIFWRGPGNYDVPDFPRTVRFLGAYDHDFQLFPFIIILFYTGEVLQRERVSRFSAINDMLPPADWVFYGSKLMALCFLPLVLAVLPMVVGIGVQMMKGYAHFNLPIYFSYCFGLLLPKYLAMLMFSVAVHALINNRFAGHAVGIIIWWMLWLANNGAVIDYNLILYSFTPSYAFTDMDGIGPVTNSLFWFSVYWLFGGGLLVVLGLLYYPRGTSNSMSERTRLAMNRFKPRVIVVTIFLVLGFLTTGIYNYYEISYRGTYLFRSEAIQRAVDFEKELKKYEDDLLPSIVKLKLFTDIFPDEHRTSTRADITIVNKTTSAIGRILLDGDQFSQYSIKYNGKNIKYISPLVYRRASLNFFRPAFDTSMYRVYQFPQPLAPGDSAIIELTSVKEILGFSNRFSATDVLTNGTFFNGGLPGLGYDEDEEIANTLIRKRYDLGEKESEFPPQNDEEGTGKLLFTNIPGLVKFEATVSTSSDQVAVTSGTLEKSWIENDRRYFHYLQEDPQTYFYFPILSARYSILHDSLELSGMKKVRIDIFYDRSHSANVGRFLDGTKDGLDYFSQAFGEYQFNQLRVLETSGFSQRMSAFPECITFAEYYGWNADFTDPNQFDYCYFYTAFQVAHQWWMFQVAPNHTEGSYNISEGLSKYGALMVYEKKVGKDNMSDILHDQSGYYLDRHKYSYQPENPLINSTSDWVANNKAGLALYGLRDMIGEYSLNSAIREFRSAYMYRNSAPYAGSNDLYAYLKKHVPDSLQYYLKDSWERITMYDNRITWSAYSSEGGEGKYRVQVKVKCGKFYYDSAGAGQPASMDDYIDIGIFGADKQTDDGIRKRNPLYLKKYKLTAGEHSFDFIVNEKPVSAGIDPYGKLIDQFPGDNMKGF